MKKFICILLMLLFALPALAEESPYAFSAPDSVTAEEGEGATTFVYGTSRVVAIVIDRVPDEKPAEAVIRMMGQFDPEAVIGEDLPLAEGFSGVSAVTKDKFGKGIDALTIMVLSASGDLLILSGYDMSGSNAHAQALLNSVLQGVTANDQPILAAKE